MTATSGPTRGAADREWRRAPGIGRALRIAAWLLPVVFAWGAVRAMSPLFLGAEGVGGRAWVGAVLWLVQAVVVAVATSKVVERLAVRLMPLAALFEATMVFPDHAPSRFGTALRSGGVRRLASDEALSRAPLGTDASSTAARALELVTALSAHDRKTRGHTERVRAYADMIGTEMGLDEDDRQKLAWGVLLHDIGKMTVPGSILNKESMLTEDEWQLLKGHPGAATEMLAPLEPWLGEWLRAAPEHHERWDGTGYPAGLEGSQISLAGRICAVADAYDVITSTRSYKKPMSTEAARAELVRCAGTQFDPDVVRAFLSAGLGHQQSAGRLAWLAELPRLGQLGSTVTSSAGGTTGAVSGSVSGALSGAMSGVVSTGAAALVVASGTVGALGEVPPGLALVDRVDSAPQLDDGQAQDLADDPSTIAVEVDGAAPGATTTTLRSTSTPVPSSAVPSSAVPSGAVPSGAVPSGAAPSSAVSSSAVSSSAVPSTGRTPSTIDRTTTTVSGAASTTRPAAATQAEPAQKSVTTSVSTTSPPATTSTTAPPIALELTLGAAGNKDSKARSLLSLDIDAPRSRALPNYDTDRDETPGLSLALGGSLAGADAAQTQSWQFNPNETFVAGGATTLRIWVADEQFRSGTTIGLQAALLVCTPSCAQLAATAQWTGVSTDGFVQAELSFGDVEVVFDAPTRLQLDLFVPESLSTSGVHVAFDAGGFPARLSIG